MGKSKEAGRFIHQKFTGRFPYPLAEIRRTYYNKHRLLMAGASRREGGKMLGAPVSLNMTVVWLVAMIVLLFIEGLAPGLVSIWFAIGALAAMVSAILKAPLWLQILWFAVVSVVTLLLTRPLAKKYVNSRAVPTNADMAIGQDCVVTEAIDNVLGTGAVSVGGKIWTARMAEADGKAPAGAVLRVVRIDGVKLIVEEKNNNNQEVTL